MVTLLVAIFCIHVAVVGDSTKTYICDCPSETIQIGAPFPDSTALYCAIIDSLDQQILHGPWFYWSDSGQLIESGQYDNGKRSGEWTTWFEDGQMQSIGNYVDGERDGFWREWYPNGNPSWQGTWRGGILRGKVTTWDKEGAMAFTKSW